VIDGHAIGPRVAEPERLRTRAEGILQSDLPRRRREHRHTLILETVVGFYKSQRREKIMAWERVKKMWGNHPAA